MGVNFRRIHNHMHYCVEFYVTIIIVIIDVARRLLQTCWHTFSPFSQPRGKKTSFRYLNVAVVNKLPNQQLLNWTFLKNDENKRFRSEVKWRQKHKCDATERRLTHFLTLHTRAQHPPANPMKKFATFSAQTSPSPYTFFPLISYLTRSPHEKRKQVGFYGWTTLFLLQFIKKSIISFSHVSLHSSHGWLVLRLFSISFKCTRVDWQIESWEREGVNFGHSGDSLSFNVLVSFIVMWLLWGRFHIPYKED